ncbi:MAG: [acyl-carrier-protein] S-malonyltransferase [Micavibrio sp.]|nr:[acyl-carrier-protein] S-malonyltransferase [Micavibrio sp.]|tara:strand:- start:337 stop:1284 length:948 start_codon:yes stop_codon:yes gene_type:complete
MSRALIFPGQGSQFVGMGQDLLDSFAEAREVFERVDDALSQGLSKIILEGPDTDLNMTANTQPALMAVSMAVIEILKKQGGLKIEEICSYVAGHSLGEYSALTAAGSLEIEETARLLRIRGDAMQKAVPVGVGAMAAILGLDFEEVKAIAQEASNGQVCEAANDNSTGQVVVSGHANAVAAAITLAQEKGAKKAVELPVSAPFHCALMQPAADAMRDALAGANMKAPVVPVVANVNATATQDPEDIRDLLVAQVTGTVRWRESVIWMKDHGVEHMVELGAGKVLSGLVRRIDREIACESVGTPEQIEALIAKLKG